MNTGRTVYEDRVIKLTDLAEGFPPRVGETTFINCQINGPAIFFPQNSSFSNCAFDTPGPDAMLWDVPEGAVKIGAILLDNCSFEKCNFRGIGIVAPPDLAEQLRRELGG